MGSAAGLYRGSAVTLARDIPSHGVYFCTYEAARDILDPGSCGRGPSSPTASFVAGVHIVPLQNLLYHISTTLLPVTNICARVACVIESGPMCCRGPRNCRAMSVLRTSWHMRHGEHFEQSSSCQLIQLLHW